MSVIESIEADGSKVSPKQAKILIKELTPMLNKALSELDPDYVRNNRGVLVAEIEKRILSKRIITND